MRFGLSGAIAHRYNHVLIAICLKLFISPCPVLSQRVLDYETTSGCGQKLVVNDLDVFKLEAFPRQDLSSVKDRCINEFQGHNGKKLKVYVDEIKIGSCGIFVNIYDGDKEMHNNPRWSLGCRGAGQTVYESFSSNVVVRLDKPVSDSTNLYSFRIYITNEFGPEIDLTRPPNMSDGPSSGVIVGIAIGAGLVVVVVIVVVAVVCWRYMRMKEKAPKKGPAVFTTTASNEPPINGILKRSESKGRGSKRRNNNRPNQGGYDNKAYRNSVDGDDYSSVNGAPSGDYSSDRGGIDLKYEEEVARKEGRPYSHRGRRRREDDASSSDTYTTGTDSVFHNKAFVGDETERSDRSLRVRPNRRDRDDSSDSYVSSSRGAVSYNTDTTYRSRTDSPSRSSRGSQSSTTDGTHEPRFIKGDNARRSGRSRSHSKSSTQSGQRRRPRLSQSTGDQSDSSHRPSHHSGHHSHGHRSRSRSRSREREKKPSPYIASTRQDSVHFENSLGRSRNTNHSSRGTSDLSSTTSGVRSNFSSQRQRSTQPHVNNGYVSSNESSVTNKRVSLHHGPAKEDGKKFVKESATNGKSKKSDYHKDATLSKDSTQKIPVSKPSTTEKIRPVERTISQKRTNTRKNTDTYHMDSSSDDSSSQSDKLLKQNDKYSNRQNKSTSHLSSYRESQSSKARRELQGSTKSRNNFSDRDQYDSRQESRKPHRTESYSRGTRRKQDQNYSDYDSDHRSHRQESHVLRHLEHDRDSHKRRYQSDSRYNSDYDSDRPGRSRDHHRREYTDRNYSDYDSDRPGRSRGHHRKEYTDRNYNDYDSDRAGRSRGNHRKEYSDRNYGDYDSDHGRRRDSSRRRRNRSTDNNYRNYDSDTDRRSSRRLSHRQDRRDRYHSDEDIVDSRRQRNGSLSQRSRSNSQNYSRNNRR